MPQAIGLAKKVQHPNLGIMFNLCHFLKNEKPENLESVLKEAGTHLFSVSTCGADLDGENWGTLIQTLNEGTFPQNRLFTALKQADFNGPVGLQCYAVKGDKQANLEKSVNAWEAILSEIQ